MSVTVAEIGRLVGCSTATVSRAINNSGSVSPKTRAAVLKALQQTRYTPRRGARDRWLSSPRRGTGDLVAVVLHRQPPTEPLSPEDRGVSPGTSMPEAGWPGERSDMAVGLHRQIIDGAIAELSLWNCRAAVQFTADLLDPRFLADLNLLDKRAVLMVGEPGDRFPEFARRCRHPLVLADVRVNGPYQLITSDDFEGIQTAFAHLYELGHRKIGFVERVDGGQERLTAYHASMVTSGLAAEPGWICRGGPHIGPTVAGLVPILASPNRPTALICGNGCLAVSVIRAAHQVGLEIPRDLSVIGFDDINVSALLTPPLTVVHVPKTQIGRQATRQLMIDTQVRPAASNGLVVRLKTELVVRESTGPVSG